jgi:hypothetical protein
MLPDLGSSRQLSLLLLLTLQHAYVLARLSLKIIVFRLHAMTYIRNNMTPSRTWAASSRTSLLSYAFFFSRLIDKAADEIYLLPKAYSANTVKELVRSHL